MKILFDQMESTVIPSFYGRSGSVRAQIYLDQTVKIMRGTLAPGRTIGLHTRQTSSEMIYILSGQGKALCGEECESLFPGVCHYCPQGHRHSLIHDGDTDLTFFAAVPECGA